MPRFLYCGAEMTVHVSVSNGVPSSGTVAAYPCLVNRTSAKMRYMGTTKGSNNPFTEALAKIAKVPRAEMQKRIEQSPKEPASRHKRYKYVPAERPAKP